MPRSSRRSNGAARSRAAAAAAPDDDNNNDDAPPAQGRSVAADVRQRQRAVAEREAMRLARPEARRVGTLAHADKKRSAVSSTPFGVNPMMLQSQQEQQQASTEWCGPFSVARQMIAQREEAKRKMEEEEQAEPSHPLDEAMQDLEDRRKRKVHPSLSWKGKLPKNNPASLYAKRQRRIKMQQQEKSRVPSLVQLCTDFVAENFEYVDSLGDVPNDVRVEIAKALVSIHKLNATALRSLVDKNMETLELLDCSGIPQEDMAKTLKGLTQVRYLLLTHAGRCFGPRTVQVLLEDGRAPLICLSVAGAYILSDADASRLIEKHAWSLSSLEFETCPLLGSKMVQAIHDHCQGANLLELSFSDINLSEENFGVLTKLGEDNISTPLRSLQRLKLAKIPNLTDAMVMSVLQATGGMLDSLDISENYNLTDEVLSAVRRFCPRLRSLTANHCKSLTAVGLEALFTLEIEGMTQPPPKLKVLRLASCDYEAVTDQVLELVTQSASSVEPTTDSTRAVVPSHIISASGGLVQLDIQGSTLVTDETLEHLAATAPYTLEEINISYCPKVTTQGLGYLVEKCGRQLRKIQCWGCAQLEDEFFDGHARVDDGSLDIVGVWMKRSGTRSLR